MGGAGVFLASVITLLHRHNRNSLIAPNKDEEFTNNDQRNNQYVGVHLRPASKSYKLSAHDITDTAVVKRDSLESPDLIVFIFALVPDPSMRGNSQMAKVSFMAR